MFAIGDMTVEINSCPNCGSEEVSRNGQTRHGKQNYKCRECGRQFVRSSRVESYYETTTGVNAADAT